MDRWCMDRIYTTQGVENVDRLCLLESDSARLQGELQLELKYCCVTSNGTIEQS